MNDVFSFDSFRRLITTVADAGYRFGRFDDPPKAERVFFLRHDVDISPRAARAMGEVAAEQGVEANFFFLLNGETYDVFSKETLATMEELRAAGHAIGLHIDQAVFGDADGPLSATVQWFREVVSPIDDVISFHRPAQDVLGRTYRGVINAYAPEFYAPGRYFSDSRRDPGFLKPLLRAVHAAVPTLQLLLHPEWWYSVGNIRELYEVLLRRRREEFDTFLIKNFTKAFADVITDKEIDADGAPRV